MNLSTFWGGGGAAPYEIEQSLRFNNETENVYLSKTFSSDGNRKKWTWSAWIKLGRISDEGHVFEAYTGSGDYELFMRFNSNDSIRFGQFTNTAYDWKLDTTAKFRDPSAWYHVVLVFDSDNATSSDRARIYVNGERVTTFDSATYPASGANGYVNKSGYPHYLCNSGLTTRDFGGYLAEVNFIDGVAVTDALDFGEYDDNGVWRPIKYAGSYTGNSFYLKFDAADVDGDSSGLGNDFTATGVTTSGTGTDVMDDTPTTNWATFNPLQTRSGYTLQEGNLKVDNSSTSGVTSVASIFVNSGKWYAEFTKTRTGVEDGVGIATDQYRVDEGFYSTEKLMSFRNGNVTYSDFGSSTFPSYQNNGDKIRVKLDLDNQKFAIAVNSGSFTEVSITSYDSHTAGEYWTFCVHNGSSGGSGSSGFIANFGQRAFEYTVPTGFQALNTANLPEPDIADGSEYFQTVLWTGDNTDDRSITVADNSGNSWQPDWVWYKRRNLNASHLLFDAVRGATKALSSNNTNAENTEANALQAFESTGFQVGSDSNSNSSSYNYVAWNWLAGNGTTTPTQGTIASTASVNQTAGFSIVSYVGTGSSGTVGHGLGVAPDMVITKARDGGDHGWGVYHRYGSQGAETQLQLHSTVAPNTGTSFWNGTHPTSTVFTINTSSATNNNGSNMIAYCFAEVEGYSKFGSYTGNGSTDGVFVYTGFRPSFILQKRSSGNAGWNIWDTTRNSYNVAGRYIQPNSSDAESNDTTNYAVDILSNGFKLRSSYFAVNGSGNTFIFAAFSENPFGGSGVSPATAR